MIQKIDVNAPWFSFEYDGVPFEKWIPSARIEEQVSEAEGEVVHEITYRLKDGLTLTWRVRVFEDFDACHWVLYLSNEGTADTKQIARLSDCDFQAEFLDVPYRRRGFSPDPDTVRMFKTIGSNWERREFYSEPEALPEEGEIRCANRGGRSSQGLAPFFDLSQKDSGLLMAIGWTGQWNASFRVEKGWVRMKSGVEGLDFYLRPGEKIRTSSTLLMKYTGGQNVGHNRFRRLLRRFFSLIGQPGRPEHGPLCSGAWGSVPTDSMCRRIEALSAAKLGLEYYWIDAGWYGHSRQKCENEFVGDWAANTGSWNVNELYHPDGLKEVAAEVKKHGMGLILWMEPERVLRGTDTPNQHPQWFYPVSPDGNTLLANLGDEEARRGITELVAEKIEALDLAWYRQDFNCDPLPFWREADEEGRAGLSEVRHIMGLYRFWDDLLERFPHLMIDNCASGGRRIDIETLSRSMPLWRSDYQCTFDADPETTQVHNTGISWWLPYSGTGMGKVMGDTYRARSCYSASLTQSFWMYEEDEVNGDESLEWARRIFAEYLSVRPYFSCDYYPLLYKSVDDTGWCGWQYDRPEQNDGIVMLFRRGESPAAEITLRLPGIPEDNRIWEFEDADSGEKFRVSGHEAARGVAFRIEQPRASRLLRYRLIG